MTVVRAPASGGMWVCECVGMWVRRTEETMAEYAPLTPPRTPTLTHMARTREPDIGFASSKRHSGLVDQLVHLEDREEHAYNDRADCSAEEDHEQWFD